jgi:hypothetical protein
MRTVGRYSVSSFLSAVVTIAFIGLAIALAIALVVLVISPWADLGGNGQLSIPVALAIDEQALHISAPSLGAGSAKLTRITGTLEFSPPSRRDLIAPLLTVAAMLLVAGWVLHQLRQLFRALRDGRVFARENARYVQRVGWAVLLIEPVGAVITYSSQAYAQAHFVADGLRFTTDLDLNFGTIFSGLVILVIAEVFRAGTKLDEDQSLTI